VRLLALLSAVAFLVVGALGFGHGRLFGTFDDSTLLNLVHLAFGLAGIALARRAETSRAYLVGGGIASLVLWLVGVAALGGWIPLNAGDNWLHLVLGAAMVLALFPGREDLGDDLERDLGGGLAAELQADRPAH
jgi:peptidoglycan/LPS O-acetylase OafA/YrhL